MENSQYALVRVSDLTELLTEVKALKEIVTNGKPNEKEVELLTTQEAAKRLRVSSKTVLNYIEVGKLKAINMNKGTDLRCRYKIYRSDLEAFIKSKRG